MLNKIVTLENLTEIYEKEIRKNIKNKKRIYTFELHKLEYLLSIRDELLSGTYKGGKYNIFLISKPKLRLIMSQNIYDKVINHFVTRYILEPKLSKCLVNNNTATRKSMGTSYAINLCKKFLEENKKYENIYVLKFDIAKYFYSINHQKLKGLIKKDLTTDEYNLVKKIIESTNALYINEYIKKCNKKHDDQIPIYEKGRGLPIGNLSSQFLAIFYLSKLHKYIIKDLGLKYLVIYMDDYIIIHHDKKYLQDCLQKIENILNEEYKLNLNKNKTQIRNIKEGIVFLGYNFRVINKKTIIKISSETKRRLKQNLKKLKYESNNGLINFEKEFSSIMNYKNSFIFANKYEIDKIIKEKWC